MLSNKQRSILEFIQRYFDDNGDAPTLREIASFLGTKNLSTAQYHVEQLKKSGFLQKSPNVSRGVSLSDRNTVSVLGYIAAGKPIEPIENPEVIDLPSSIKLQNNHSYYALIVKGDSMVDMGIVDGDTVIIQNQFTAENGDTVVAITEDGATLKVFKRIKNKVVLEPRNSIGNYSTIIPKRIEIRGKFIGLIRPN